MPGGRATATTVGMRLGIIRGPATDIIGIRAALNPGTEHITIAAPMLCPGTVGTHLHITAMGPVLGEIGPNVQDLHHPLLAGLPAHSGLLPEADIRRAGWDRC